jgi:uncharacterized protein
MKNWEILFEQKITEIISHSEIKDSAHDLLHFKRVVALTRKLSLLENADLNIAVPAAWLHDLINVPKDSPIRNQASRLSADAAIQYLQEINYPKEYHARIHHAISSHSFSADLKTETLEAQIVQDADRLDSLGAIGITRCFATAGLLNRKFYSEDDPFCLARQPDDSIYTIDHFYIKLFFIADRLHTPSARAEGLNRVHFLKTYLKQLRSEIYIS